MNRKRIVFCIPGKSFSGCFLQCWTNLVGECLSHGIDAILVNRYTSNVYYVRSQCLGADVLRGKNQKPWNGKLDYDYIMWIDSDIIFKPDQFFKLLKHEKDIVGGLYLMDGGTQFPVIKNWDESFFEKNGRFEFLTPLDISGKSNLEEIVYTGFGFLLVKKGVFEKITYPWFEPRFFNFSNNVVDFCSEDVGFCLKAREAGFKIHVDPTIIVGHEKTQILNISEATIQTD